MTHGSSCFCSSLSTLVLRHFGVSTCPDTLPFNPRLNHFSVQRWARQPVSSAHSRFPRSGWTLHVWCCWSYAGASWAICLLLLLAFAETGVIFVVVLSCFAYLLHEVRETCLHLFEWKRGGSSTIHEQLFKDDSSSNRIKKNEATPWPAWRRRFHERMISWNERCIAHFMQGIFPSRVTTWKEYLGNADYPKSWFWSSFSAYSWEQLFSALEIWSIVHLLITASHVETLWTGRLDLQTVWPRELEARHVIVMEPLQNVCHMNNKTHEIRYTFCLIAGVCKFVGFGQRIPSWLQHAKVNIMHPSCMKEIYFDRNPDEDWVTKIFCNARFIRAWPVWDSTPTEKTIGAHGFEIIFPIIQAVCDDQQCLIVHRKINDFASES